MASLITSLNRTGQLLRMLQFPPWLIIGWPSSPSWQSTKENPNMKMVKEHFNPKFSTMNFSTPWFKTSWFKSPGLKSSWFKNLGLKGLGLKLGVEKSGVEMSFNRWKGINLCQWINESHGPIWSCRLQRWLNLKAPSKQDLSFFNNKAYLVKVSEKSLKNHKKTSS